MPHLSTELTLLSSTLSSIQLEGTLPPRPRRPLPRPRGFWIDGWTGSSGPPRPRPRPRPPVGWMEDDGRDDSSTCFGLFLLPGFLPLFFTGAGSLDWLANTETGFSTLNNDYD